MLLGVDGTDSEQSQRPLVSASQSLQASNVQCSAVSQIIVILLKAKFHYAIWFETGRRQVRSWLQSATSFEQDSVMEFGFNCYILFLHHM